MEKPDLLTRIRTRLAIWSVVLLLFGGGPIFATNTTLSFPEPLTAVNPLASLIYNGSVSGGIQSASDTTSYTLPVNAGETITVDVTSAASLQATINLTDPSNNVIGTATAAAAGQEVVLQTVPANTTGTYTISVGGASSSTGAFTVSVTLNGALDIGSHGGGELENATIATAQDLSGSAFSLAAGADRLAVVGHFEGTDDFYSFVLQAAQSSSLALTLTTSASVALELEDGSGNVLATGVAGPQNVSLVIKDFVAAATGIYYARITGAGQSNYSLIVTRNADFELEPNDQANPENLDTSHAVLGYIGNGEAMRDTDWYSFDVNAGDNLVLNTATPSDQGGEFHNNLVPQIDLYDNNFTRVATNMKQPKNTPVIWTALTSGTYFARVSAANVSGAKHSVGEYVLTIQGATGP